LAELATFVSQKRAEIEDLLKHRFFYKPSFDIYGGSDCTTTVLQASL
jgi:glycyl-tRNA synthetase (class II)